MDTQDVARQLLSYSGFQPAQPFDGSGLLERVAGSVARTLPPSERRLPITGVGEQPVIMLVLDGEGEASTLYRATFRRDDEATTLNVERIDLWKVVRVTVSDGVADREGNWRLKSLWHFEFEGADPVDIEDDQIVPERGSAGPRHRFGRQIAEAAGWGPETNP